jgi:hypothetical protein
MSPRPAHRPRRAPGCLAVFLTVGGLALAVGCDRATSEEPPPADSSPEPGADAYAAAIAEVVEVPEEPPVEAPDPLPILYVVPIDGSLGIDAQASVIDALAVWYDVRFVDELAAAVVADAPGRPPRDEAIVLGVGPIDPNPPHLLRIERYHTVIDIDATLLTLAYVVDNWVVIAAEPVPAEALIDAG